MNHYLLLRLAKDGVKVSEAAALVNGNYRAVKYHFQKAEADGFISREPNGTIYRLTVAGQRELDSLLIEEHDPLREANMQLQLTPLSMLDYDAQKLLSTSREDAIKWLTENPAAIERVIIFSAIAMENMTQLDKIPRKE